MRLSSIVVTLTSLYGASALYLPSSDIEREESFTSTHPLDGVIPLITPIGEPSTGQRGRCVQNMTMNPAMTSVELPEWVGHQWSDISLLVDCQFIRESTAIAAAGTEPLQLAKYFVVSYFSTIHVMDWRKAELNSERMEIVERYWETGRFYREGEQSLRDFADLQKNQ